MDQRGIECGMKTTLNVVIYKFIKNDNVSGVLKNKTEFAKNDRSDTSGRYGITRGVLLLMILY